MAGRRSRARAMAAALLLSAGERDAALADHGLKALRKLLELLADVRGFGGFEHLFRAGMRRAEGQVFADGFAEEEGLLRNHADVAAQHGQRIIAHRRPSMSSEPEALHRAARSG
jgi:hypothetical protein